MPYEEGVPTSQRRLPGVDDFEVAVFTGPGLAQSRQDEDAIDVQQAHAQERRHAELYDALQAEVAAADVRMIVPNLPIAFST